MCGEKEVLNLIHQLLGGVDLPHRRVDDVHLALKLELLLIQFCEVESHVTDDQAVHDRAKDENGNCDAELFGRARAHLADTKQVVADVESDKEPLVPVHIVVLVDLRRADPQEVLVWHPVLILLDHIVPDATDRVDIDKHDREEHDHFAK